MGFAGVKVGARHRDASSFGSSFIVGKGSFVASGVLYCRLDERNSLIERMIKNEGEVPQILCYPLLFLLYIFIMRHRDIELVGERGRVMLLEYFSKRVLAQDFFMNFIMS